MKTLSLHPKSKNQTLRRAGQCLYRSSQSKIYYAIFKRERKQIKRSLKTTDKEQAKRQLEYLRQKIVNLNVRIGREICFSELAKRWLATKASSLKPSAFIRRKTSAMALLPHFKMPLRSIGKTHLEAWARVRAPQVSARTFNMDKESLCQILDYAVYHGLILENLAKIIPRRKQPKSNIIIPTKAQFSLLIEALKKEPLSATAVNLCQFLAYSGCRLGEAIGLRWNDINFETKTLTITGGEFGTKTNEPRRIPLFKPLESLLLKMKENLVAPFQEAVFGVKSSKSAINTACRKSGLPHFSHHSLRHFFCSNAIEENIDFKVISHWLGHKDGGVLVAKTYGHLRDEHSLAMAKRMTFEVPSCRQL